jgi:hypothetical protein
VTPNFLKAIDIVFNGRPADPQKDDNAILLELIRRKVSTMRINGKLYRIEVKELDRGSQ